jgi:probable rRNA maturation factor
VLDVNVFEHKWYDVVKDPEDFVLRIVRTALQKLNIVHYSPSISVALADDCFMRELNLRFRNIDAPTNVLSFPCEHLSNECDLGDIALSIDTIQKESCEYDIPLSEHIAHMLIHGLLHLLGYDHKTQAEEIVMQDLERTILILLNFNI